MPTISEFYGIQIRIFVLDHPPHFHARYGEHEACFSILDGGILEGSSPPSARRLIREWVALRGAELAAAWKLAASGELPPRIEGLDAD